MIKHKTAITLIFIALFITTGCASIGDIHTKDVCVVVSGANEKLCKSEAKILPPDFPDRLFKELFCDPPSFWDGIDPDGDGYYDEIWLGWTNENGFKAILHLTKMTDDEWIAWGLVIFNGKARIAWFSKDATQEQKAWLRRIVIKFNRRIEKDSGSIGCF